jgi:hypothetical protein
VDVGADATRALGRRLGAGALLLTLVAVGCGGSGVKDTKGGLVGRMSPGCVLTLATIDEASLKGGATRPQTAEKAALGLAEVTETTCLEQITDWPVAVARLQERLALAGQSAGKTTPTITCAAPADWAGEVQRVPGYEIEGYVERATTGIHLSPLTCFDLARLAGRPRGLSCLLSSTPCPPSVTTEAIAVVILAHEEQHVDGETNEALAQCYAFQRAQAVARQLGVPRRAAARIAALAKRAITQPFVYSSSECRRGGSFDLHLPGPWPLAEELG